MRILHVVTAFHLGGTEQVAIDLSVWFKQAGHEVHVVAVSKDPAAGAYGAALCQRMSENRISYSEIGGSNFRASIPALPLRLRRLIRNFKPDLVHSHADLPDFAVATVGRLQRFAAVRTIHSTSLWPTHPLIGCLTESAFDGDLIVAVSRDAMRAHEALRAKYRLPCSQFHHIIAPGVRVPTDVELIKRLATAPVRATRRIAFLGRNDPLKGLDVFLEAMRLATPKDLAGAHVVIHTPGYCNTGLQSAVRGMTVPISLLPPIPDVREQLHLFDLVVMPSRFEGLPLLAIECLAAGTPLLASRVPGLREAMPPDWPLMMEPEDPAALLSGVRAFLGGGVDVGRLAQTGRKWVRRFSQESACARYHDAYVRYLDTLRLKPASVPFATPMA